MEIFPKIQRIWKTLPSYKAGKLWSNIPADSYILAERPYRWVYILEKGIHIFQWEWELDRAEEAKIYAASWLFEIMNRKRKISQRVPCSMPPATNSCLPKDSLGSMHSSHSYQGQCVQAYGKRWAGIIAGVSEDTGSRFITIFGFPCSCQEIKKWPFKEASHDCWLEGGPSSSLYSPLWKGQPGNVRELRWSKEKRYCPPPKNCAISCKLSVLLAWIWSYPSYFSFLG